MTDQLTQMYQRAIDELERIGLAAASDFVPETQDNIKQILKKRLASFDIDAKTKAILTTEQNRSLAARILLEVEDELDSMFTPAGADIMETLNARAYRIGAAYQNEVSGEAARGLLDKLLALELGSDALDAQIFSEYSAQTMLLVRQKAGELIVGFAEDQKEYIRKELLKATIENRTYGETMDRLISDGKVPALEITDKNGVKRRIDMQTRVQTMVRTEYSAASEQASQDRAEEIYGDELYGEWRGISDSRTRRSHLIRIDVVRSADEWKSEPYTDGKIILPGREPNCRCYMKWGTAEDFGIKKSS